MLRLSVFVAGRKRIYNPSMGLSISASKHCRKMKFRTYIHLTLVRKILSRLSDFVTCSEHFNIQSEGSISQLWNTVGRIKFKTYLHLTLISKIFMLSWLSDFVVCSTSLYICCSGVYI